MPPIVEVLAETVGHFFPGFGHWLAAFPDPRCAGKVVYPAPLCLWSALSLLVRGLGSRRQFDAESRRDAASAEQRLLQNLNLLAGTDASDLMHGDTLNDYLAQLEPKHLASVPPRMVRRLERMRALEHARLQGRYLIAIDATGLWSWKQRHCDTCLHQTQNGVTTYYHLTLEAKLITPEGLALSVGTEFIENVDPQATKQDCERAAITRLLPKLKVSFPRLPICLLFDAAYATQTVLRACRRNNWAWIISFKSGSLPTAFREFQTLKTLTPDQVLETRVGGRYQRLSWIHDLEHEEFRFAALDCLTYNDDGEVVYFAWITNLPVRRDTVVALANHGGRKRWTIENQGFRNQKHQEYRLTHPYSDNPTALKNYYFLIQIAHAFVQLLARGRLAGVFRRVIVSVRNLFRCLADSFLHDRIPAEAVDPVRLTAIQIRFDNTS
ncbi:MAG: hypothetical protein EA405_14590 [Rhodospirillales bacterium]|nr:MAG: hypothetical protein EA405_14590 [Rhodospirillales bacterium]